MAPAEKLSFSINDVSYRIQPGSVATLPRNFVKKCNSADSQFVLATAIEWTKSAFSQIYLKSVCRLFDATDDVWSPGFLSIVVLLKMQSSSLNDHKDKGNIISLDRSQHKLNNGPYAVSTLTGEVFRVWRVYLDTHHAFFIDVPEEQYSRLDLRVPGSVSVTAQLSEIPVLSRLYQKKSEDKPLAGLRFALKDTITFKGLRTGYGSQAYVETYPAESKTAPAVQVLLDAGAIMVGKTKTTEFSEGVDPVEWTETTCPYNPRGDGAQKPSSSSTGSAVAAAAYHWLDFTVGTDTGGSVRHPAGVNGVFGNRPTQGAISLEGVLGATNLFNTVGIFARDVSVFNDVGTQLLQSTHRPQVRPPRQRYNLLYLTRVPHQTHPPEHRGGQHRWFPHPQDDPSLLTESDKQMESFVQNLESELCCKRIPINIYELWRATPPKGQPRCLDQALGHVYSAVTTYSAVHTGMDKFVADYAATQTGRTPYVSPLVQRRQDFGRKVSSDSIADALDAIQAFTRWLEDFVFGSFDEDTTTLMIFPQSCGAPEYRDEIPDRSVLFNDMFSIYSFGYMVGCPDYTIPIAEVPYHSRVSNKMEQFPVSVSLVGRPGSDKHLFDLLSFLHGRGVLRDVQAGARMYPEPCESRRVRAEMVLN